MPAGWKLLLTLGGMSVAVAIAFHALGGAEPPKAQAASETVPPAVPVVIATATRRDVPIYATGLGTVEASFTIGIHAQVDGIMQEVLFTEGAHVKKGDILARIDPRMFQAAYDQAKAKQLQDVAMLGGARKDLDRSRMLKDFATRQLVDQQQAKVDQLDAAIAADNAAIEAAQTQLDFTTIRSPSDGRVGVRQIDPGNLIHASDAGPIATVVLTQPSAMLFTLPMQFLDDVRSAMARGSVEVAAFDQHKRRELARGTLLLIDNAIDETTATLRLKAMFPNKDELLWPGEFVNARVLLDTRKDALVIPSAAIQRGAQGMFVWVVGADGRAEVSQITPGPISEDMTIVTAGLKEGDRVVTDGQYRLQPDALVTAAASNLSDGSPE